MNCLPEFWYRGRFSRRLRRGPLRAAGVCRGRPAWSRQRDRDLEAGHRPLRRDTAGIAPDADGIEEREQLGAQRLVMADRQMPHRIAAVGLESRNIR